MPTTKYLIRQRGCAGWSESSFGAQVRLYVFLCSDLFLFFYYIFFKWWISTIFTRQIKLPALCENVSSGICGQWKPKSASAFAQSDQVLYCPLTELLDTIECMNGEEFRWGFLQTKRTDIQSTLVISNSKDSLKYFEKSVPRYIRFAEFSKKINRTTTFNKCVCHLTPEVRDILKILWKRGEIAP